MTYRELAVRAQASAGVCVALLGFAIPVSTALDAVLLGLVVLAWLVAAPAFWRDTARSYVRFKAALVGFLIFAALLVSAAYSTAAWPSATSAAFKYVELALIPVFIWAGAAAAARKWAFLGYLAAVVLTLLVSFGSAIGVWESLPGLRTGPGNPVGFKLSLTHNFVVALGAFGLLLLARELRETRPRAAMTAAALALACVYNVLFIVGGRTGYVVLAALLLYFAGTMTRGRRDVAVAALLMVSLLAAAYLGSAAFSERVQDIVTDFEAYPRVKDHSSGGMRLGFYRTTAAIVSEHPLTGVGAGGFERAYREKVSGTDALATANPHNDFLMIAAQAGLAAGALLLALYVILWRDARRLRSRLERDLLRGLVLAFAIGGIFNSFLMDHAEGLLFAWSTGMLYAGARAIPGNLAGHPA